MMEEITLRDYGEERTTVHIGRRRDGSVYISIERPHQYGYPAFELKELKRLTKKAEALEKSR